MESVFLNKKLYQQWDSFVKESNEAWFWHTREWLDYAAEYSADKFVKNVSFVIKEDSAIQAVCPVFIEKVILNERFYNRFSCGGGSIAALAVSNNCKPSKKSRIIKFYLNKLNEISKQNNVDFVNVKLTPVTKPYLISSFPKVNPFVRCGYTDLACQTQVIDLRKTHEGLWSDVRKGHKSNIKKGAKTIKNKLWNSENITIDKIEQYRGLHCKDAGRVTRSQKTFQLMYEWIKYGESVLLEAECNSKSVGFTLVIAYKQGAYYASSCKDPDYVNLPVSHLLQWEAIMYLKSKGKLFYDIGIQEYCAQWFNFPSDKDFSISKFKRGFGGKAVPLITAEYYFSKRLMREMFLSRVNNYCNSSVDCSEKIKV